MSVDVNKEVTKLIYQTFQHTDSSMLRRGMYPEGMTEDDVRKFVEGSFGGRFNYFKDGKFEFIAYTD